MEEEAEGEGRGRNGGGLLSVARVEEHAASDADRASAGGEWWVGCLLVWGGGGEGSQWGIGKLFPCG